MLVLGAVGVAIAVALSRDGDESDDGDRPGALAAAQSAHDGAWEGVFEGRRRIGIGSEFRPWRGLFTFTVDGGLLAGHVSGRIGQDGRASPIALKTPDLPITAPCEGALVFTSSEAAESTPALTCTTATSGIEVVGRMTARRVRPAETTSNGTTPPVRAIEIRGLRLFDTDHQPLQFLSASPHSYNSSDPVDPRYRSSTLVHARMEIGPVPGTELAPGDKLESLLLEVRDRTEARKAWGDFTLPLPQPLPFVVARPSLLFRIPSGRFADVNQTTDEQFRLVVIATTSSGAKASATYDVPVTKLVLFKGRNREPGRDAALCIGTKWPCGGDGWTRPSVKAVVEHYSTMVWGDFSNMNGGPFPPHTSHTTAIDVDGTFAGFSGKTRRTADLLLTALNDPVFGRRIGCIFVSFPENGEFEKRIRSQTLRDGRRAALVVRRERGHSRHFHFRIANRPTRACADVPRVP